MPPPASHRVRCSASSWAGGACRISVWATLSPTRPSSTRQAAGQRVATGSVRELFGRLRHYRNRQQKRGGNPLLVIVGHSFGGMIVFSALAQSLIQAASAPVGRMTPEFADLVLLVNPAIEGARYHPDLRPCDQCGLSRRARRSSFRSSSARRRRTISRSAWCFRSATPSHAIRLNRRSGIWKRWCVTHAFGFVPNFRTHKLTGPTADKPFALDPPEHPAQINPFWMVGAAKEVIDGHGGIWQTPFLQFIASVVFQHMQASKKAPARRRGRGGRAEAAPSGDLAEFAKTIGPIELPKR